MEKINGRKRSKRYCIAVGCMNSNKKIPDLTLFTLPKEPERRQKWLSLIGREDLLEKEDLKCFSYEVCESHFDDSDITVVKKLKGGTVPTKHLYADLPPIENVITVLTENECDDNDDPQKPVTNITMNQSEPTTADPLEQNTQTSKALSEKTPQNKRRKRKH